MEGAAGMGVGALLAGAVAALVGGYLQVKRARHEQNRENRADERSGLREQVDLLQTHYEASEKEHRADRERWEQVERELRQEGETCREDNAALKVEVARAVARIEHLEEVLTDHNIRFRPFSPGGSSTHHRPLPPEAKADG